MTAGNIAIDEDHLILMERLSAQDLMNLWPDELGWPMDLGALAILDGTQLIDPDGRFKIETAREAIARRLHLVPGSASSCTRLDADSAGRYGWMPSILISRRRLASSRFPHRRARRSSCSPLSGCGRRLDRSRPLWEMWFLPGLPQHRVSGCTTPSPTAWPAWPCSERFSISRPTLPNRCRRGPQHHCRQPASSCKTPCEAGSAPPSSCFVGWVILSTPHVGYGRPGLRRGSASRTAAPTNKPEPPDRGTPHHHDHSMPTRPGQADRPCLRGQGQRRPPGGSRWRPAAAARRRGEPVDGVVLRAFVPVSLHHEQGGQARQSRCDHDRSATDWRAVRGLRLIATSTAERKKRTRSPGINAFPNGAVQRMAWRMAAHQHFMNLSVTNVPGPPRPLHLLGRNCLRCSR